MKPSRLIASALLLFGAFLVAFATGNVLSRRRLALSGVIVASDTRCQQPQNNRCVSTYVLRQPNGAHVTYLAASDDTSLQRRLPIGTVLEKSAGTLGYRVNGVAVDDFPFIAYGAFITIGAILVLGSAGHLLLQRRAA